MSLNLKKLAQVLVRHSTGVKPGELVGVRYDPLAVELASAIQQEALRAGANVIFRTQPAEAEESFLKFASDQVLETVNPLYLWYADTVNVDIVVTAPTNIQALAGIDPGKIARRIALNKVIGDRQMERERRGEYRWVITELPTHARAQAGKMSLAQLDELIARAGMLHLDDPAAYWQAFHAWQQEIVDELNNGHKQIHIEGPNIDLRFSIKGRTWINCAGTHNFPDGEVFTGPVETSADGWFRTTLPANYAGNTVEGAELHFKKGRVVKATARSGEDFLNAALNTDKGARTVGEFGIGTHQGNTTPTGSILLDEKMGGTVHVALGRGYPESGNTNQSAIHWDIIIPMEDGRIIVDGQTVYENGEFTIGDPTARPSLD